MRKPTQKKRNTLHQDKPVAVPVGETPATGDQLSLRERIWHFVGAHCRIL